MRGVGDNWKTWFRKSSIRPKHFQSNHNQKTHPELRSCKAYQQRHRDSRLAVSNLEKCSTQWPPYSPQITATAISTISEWKPSSCTSPVLRASVGFIVVIWSGAVRGRNLPFSSQADVSACVRASIRMLACSVADRTEQYLLRLRVLYPCFDVIFHAPTQSAKNEAQSTLNRYRAWQHNRHTNPFCIWDAWPLAWCCC